MLHLSFSLIDHSSRHHLFKSKKMSTAIKIYVHDESTQTTKILQWQTLSNHQQQMQALKARIEQEFELKKQGKVLVDLRSENNRPIHSLKDKMDIFIVVATSSEAGNSDEKKNSRLGEENQPCKASSPPSSIVITPNQMTKPPLVSEGGSSQAHDASKKSSMERGTALLSSTPSQYELQELAKNAVQFYQAKKYRVCRMCSNFEQSFIIIHCELHNNSNP